MAYTIICNVNLFCSPAFHRQSLCSLFRVQCSICLCWFSSLVVPWMVMASQCTYTACTTQIIDFSVKCDTLLVFDTYATVLKEYQNPRTFELPGPETPQLAFTQWGTEAQEQQGYNRLEPPLSLSLPGQSGTTTAAATPPKLQLHMRSCTITQQLTAGPCHHK